MWSADQWEMWTVDPRNLPPPHQGLSSVTSPIAFLQLQLPVSAPLVFKPGTPWAFCPHSHILQVKKGASRMPPFPRRPATMSVSFWSLSHAFLYLFQHCVQSLPFCLVAGLGEQELLHPHCLQELRPPPFLTFLLII